MWRLCIEDDEANRTVVNLVRKEYTIGRAEENAVRLTERNVSRRHATLRRTGDKWLLEDLESDTGSYVNERRVEEPTTIDHRDKIRIGDYDITLAVPNVGKVGMASGQAGITVEGKKAYGIDEGGEIVEPTAGEDEKKSPMPVGPAIALLVIGLAALARRRSL